MDRVGPQCQRRTKNSSTLVFYFVPLTFSLRRVAVDLILPHMSSVRTRNLILVFPLLFEYRCADFHLVLCYQMRDIPIPHSSLSASSLASHLNRLQYLPLSYPQIPKIFISHLSFPVRRNFRRAGNTLESD